ncbi:MAG: DUF3343 domain-containing protein [Planctomycetota bacterium]|nr:DUF3343 domain-containing protein [Planctomycetota bacterium]
MSNFAVIMVHTTSDAIHAERVLRRAGLAAKLIPTPRRLSSDCGSAVRISADDHGEAERLLRGAQVAIDRIEPLEA